MDGTVKNEGFTRAEQVEVTAVLSLEDQTVSWDRTVWVCPLENPDNKALIRILSWKMEGTQKEDTETVELPEQAAGQSIMWYPEKDHTWLMLAGLTACAVCAMMLGQQKEEEKALAEREKRMKLAYPDIGQPAESLYGCQESAAGRHGADCWRIQKQKPQDGSMKLREE